MAQIASGLETIVIAATPVGVAFRSWSWSSIFPTVSRGIVNFSFFGGNSFRQLG